MPLDEPTQSFMQLGIPRRAAKATSRLLRRDVTDRMCLLLPDAESSVAPGSLIGAQRILIEVVPDLTRDLIKSDAMVFAPDVANSSALPLILLEAMIFELVDRAGMKMGTAAMRRPSPSGFLVEARSFNTRRIAGGDGVPAITPDLQLLLGGMVRRFIVESIAAQESHGRAQEWTGWALLAAMHAMETYDHKLPVPGRTLRDLDGVGAYLAFDMGRRIIVAAAIDLIDQAERDAATDS
ncbi:hypothetical protein [Actinomadura latina]|nr:hypothetical protein [Actinomadura latina]